MRRKVTEDDRCDLCGQIESGVHVLFLCPAAKQIWKQVRGVERNWSGATSVIEVWGDTFSSLSKELQGRWAVVTWGVWRARNVRIF